MTRISNPMIHTSTRWALGALLTGLFSLNPVLGQAQSSSSSCANYSSSSSSAATSTLSCALSDSSSWGGSYQANFTVTNNGNSAIDHWDVALQLAEGQSITSSWNVSLTGSSGTVAATNLSWNGSLQPGQSASFGIQGAQPGTFVKPQCFAGKGPNQAPIASLVIQAHGPTVFIDGSGSTDPNGDSLRYSIDFGDGKTLSGPSAWHTYHQAGDYKVTLSLSDGELSATKTQIVSATEYLGGNHAPVAMITMAGSNGSTSTSTSGSYDEDGDLLTKSFYTINNPGTRTQVVTVFDGELGDTAQASATTACGSYSDPMAYAAIRFLVNGQNLYVDPRDSSNATGFNWNFGDGNTTITPAGYHTYTEPGQYSLSLLAHGMFFSGNTNITINVGSNNAPQFGVLNVRCKESSNSDGRNVTQCGAYSLYDPDGDPLTLTWDMGDGTSYTTQGAASRITHEFQAAGSHTIKVTANDGLASATANGYVNSAGNNTSNHAPKACFHIIQPAVIPLPLDGGFDASCSSDSDGDTLTYTWEFSDGSSDTGALVNHSFATAGQKTIRLTVSDGLASDSIEQSAQFGDTSNKPATCIYHLDSEWDTGFNGSITITNTSNTPINGWSLSLAYPGNNRITNAWNAVLTGGNPYSFSNLGWNALIQPGASIAIGFGGSKSGAAEQPLINSEICQ